jgi:hypothetical protein
MRDQDQRETLSGTKGGVMEEVFWTIVVYAFVAGVLATVVFATFEHPGTRPSPALSRKAVGRRP